MNPPISIKRRERDAVLQSLQAGLVPKQGLHLIQVGRKAEVSALLQDLDRVCDDGASFRIVVGRFGSGKSFFLNLGAQPRLSEKTRGRAGRFQHGAAAVRERRRSAWSLQRVDAQPGNQGAAGRRRAAERARGVGFPSPACDLMAGAGTADVERRIGRGFARVAGTCRRFEFAEVVRAYYRGNTIRTTHCKQRRCAGCVGSTRRRPKRAPTSAFDASSTMIPSTKASS